MTSTGAEDRSVVSVAVDDTPWCSTGVELVADRLFALGASAVSELVNSDGAGIRLVGDLPSSALDDLADTGLVFEVLEVDPTWNHQWRDHATVVTVGERLVLRPEWVIGLPSDVVGTADGGGGAAVGADDGGATGADDGDAVGRIEVVLDAGDAFGSGSHPTTRLCLEVLERLVVARRGLDGQQGSGTTETPQRYSPQTESQQAGVAGHVEPCGTRVLDVGSGTGVLGVAALLLDPSASLVAVDVDPAAIAATRRTTELNGLGRRLLEVSHRSLVEVSAEHGPFDVVLANLLIPVIESLGPSLAAVLAPGAHLVVSGLLSDPEAGQVDRAIGAVQDAQLELAGVHEAQGWAAVVFRRAVPAI